MMDKWFAFHFRRRTNKRFAFATVQVFTTAPLGVILPTRALGKNEAINEAIDRLIEHLESMRPKPKKTGLKETKE